MHASIAWVIATILIVLVAWRLDYLYQPLRQTATVDPEVEQLFNTLRDTQLIQLDQDGRVILPTLDTVLAEQAAKSAKERNRPEQRARWQAEQAYIDTLYYRPVGLRLQQQVKLWNLTRRIAAIRDNRPQSDESNQWQVSSFHGQTLERLDLVPLAFGYVAIDPQQIQLPIGFHNWGSASHASDQVLFSSEWNSRQAQTIQIHIIGRPNLNLIRQKGWRVSAYPRFSPSLPKACRDNTKADAYAITVRLPAGKHRLTIPVQSVANPYPTVEGLAISLPPQPAPSSKQCHPGITGTLTWNSEQLNNPDTGMGLGSNKPYQIISADGVALSQTDEQGKASQFSIDNGLLALVGQDKRDVYSLSGLLARSSLQQSQYLQLTLDSRWQSAAQHVLNQSVKKQALRPEQRMAIVVMNPNNGAILAAASVPTPPDKVHTWDRNAYSQLFPQQDPYRFTPWQGLTGDNAPGSTFKTVTALAALNASRHQTNILPVLQGMPLAKVTKVLGMDINSATWQPPNNVPSVSNALPHETLAWAASKPLYACPESRQRTGRVGEVGLQMALSQSLNTWFSRMAVLMDANALKQGAEYSELVKMSRLLSFGNIYDLWPSIWPLKRMPATYLPLPAQCLTNPTALACLDKQYLGSGDVLNAFTGQLDLTSQQARFGGDYRSLLNRLVRASYGQAMTATPLQMANIAASIATGERQTPQLIQKYNQQSAPSLPAPELSVPHLNYLRDAMKSVTEQGTAAYSTGTTFAGQQRCQVYGKTGTADVGSGKGTRRTAWFMGWLGHPEQGVKVAFSCMVTHASGSGGSVCAPLISELLQNTVELHGVKP